MLKVLLESNVVLRSVGRGKRRDVVFGSSNALLKVSIATETEHEKVTLDKGDAYGTYDECLVPLLPSMPVHSPPVGGNFCTSPEIVLVNFAFNFFLVGLGFNERGRRSCQAPSLLIRTTQVYADH